MGNSIYPFGPSDHTRFSVQTLKTKTVQSEETECYKWEWLNISGIVWSKTDILKRSIKDGKVILEEKKGLKLIPNKIKVNLSLTIWN